MPELPEVETIRLGLQKYLVGHIIEDVEVRLAKIITGETKNIIGARVVGVRRFGKGLVIDLNNGYSIAAHIKLTGQFVYRDAQTSKVKLSPKVGTQIPNKFTHVTFKLDPSASSGPSAFLYYNDIRQFGWIKIIKSSDLKTLPFFKELGPEPLNNLTMKQFSNIVSSSNSPIKPLIMDQKKMSGLGNIYANDALFDAAIDPRRKAKTLTGAEIKKLYDSILKVLKIGLESGGASELNYVNALGQEGKYQTHFLAYGKDGEKCVRCGSIIKKIKLGGRGTYFCEGCQR